MVFMRGGDKQTNFKVPDIPRALTVKANTETYDSFTTCQQYSRALARFYCRYVLIGGGGKKRVNDRTE